MLLRDMGKCLRIIRKGLKADIMFQRVTAAEAALVLKDFRYIISMLQSHCKEKQECLSDFELFKTLRDGEFAELFEDARDDVRGEKGLGDDVREEQGLGVAIAATRFQTRFSEIQI